MPQPVSDARAAPAPTGGERARPRLAEATLDLKPARSMSSVVLTGGWRIAEWLLIAAIGVVVHWFTVMELLGWPLAYVVAIPVIATVGIAVLQSFDTYAIAALRAPFSALPRLLAAWALVFLIAFASLFFLKLDITVSRLFMGAWFMATPGVLLLARLAFALRIRGLTRRGLLDRRTAVIGGGEAAERLLRALRSDGPGDIRIVGVFDDRADERSPDVIAGFPKLGAVDDLVDYARHARLDLVICALPMTAETRLLDILRKLWVLPLDIRLAADSQKLRFRPRNYSYIGSLPVLDMLDKPIADWDVVLKWLFDKCVGLSLLILLSPVMLAVAIAVRLDSKGPSLFRQKRYGFNNEMIEVFKFRSMYVEQSDATASKLVTRGDPRVTRVGRFIRKTSLDELPQLFNVVFGGKLSIVGPRPHAVHAKAENRLYDEVVEGYFARHRVKPGITGWAQVNGWRGETDTEEKIRGRVACDLEYIDRWSIWFDLQILFMTPLSLLKSENAY
ncbi:MAG: undecaprenyl-phosphate glucose phosphotransferase [Beijerinckiaceae bacterium]